MTRFTPKELDYLTSQKLGRLATLDPEGAPNNVPVGYRYNAELDTIDIGGYKLSDSKKFKNVQDDGRVSFVVDDVLPPWEPRGLEIRGIAESLSGLSNLALPDHFDAALIRIKPTHIISWGIDTHPYKRNSRKV